jgi:pimeloyl-ACP methyl ester carboxylesterase
MQFVSTQSTRRFICLLPLLLLTGCANMFMLHPQMARMAEAERPVNPTQFGDAPEVVTVTNALGHRLTGWVFASPTNHGVLLAGDGNATGLAQTYDYNRYLLHHGFNVVVLSYQGFDANGGKRSLRSLSGDVEAFYDLCRKRFANQPVAVSGESISAGVFFCFVSRHPELAGAVLEGTVDLRRVTFTVINQTWQLYLLYPITGPLALAITAAVPKELSAERALERHPKVPALFIHHPQDPVTPYRDARRIFERYEGEKKFVEPNIEAGKGSHMTGQTYPEVRAEVIEFLRRRLGPE